MNSDSRTVKAVLVFAVVIVIWQFLVAAEFSRAEAPLGGKDQQSKDISLEAQKMVTLCESAGRCFSQGLSYYDIGRWHEAIEAFKKATLVKPDYELAYFGLGITYSRLELWEKALVSFAKAVELSPYYAEAYLGLGMAYTVLGQNDSALVACKKAIQLKSGYAQAHYALALLYLKLGDRTSALEEYSILKRLAPSLAAEISHLIGN